MAAKFNWKKKFTLLTGSTVLMLVISLSWAVVVDSIPKSERPYIGSSQTNSVLELAFGYNGLSRLTGNQGPDTGMNNNKNQQQQANHSANTSTNAGNGNQAGSVSGSQTGAVNGNMNGTQGGPPNGGSFGGPPNGGTGGTAFGGPNGGPGGGNSGGMFGTGAKGPFRLFQSGLSGQASWLLPFTLIALAGMLAGMRRKTMTLKQIEILFWLAWLLPAAVFFSVAGFFHQYYLIMLAPAIAAIFGIGAVQLIDDYRHHTGWKSWLLPIAVVTTIALQWYIIHPYDSTIGSGWSIGVAAAGMIFTIILILYKNREKGLKYHFALAGLVVLLIGPLYWAATPIMYGGNSMTPEAGPTQSAMGGMGGFPAGARMAFSPQAGGANGNSATQTHNNPSASNQQSRQNQFDPSGSQSSIRGRDGEGMNGESLDQKTYNYLKQQNTGEKYLFATTSYQTAAPYIIDKGESVITMGGFSGNDPVYSVAQIKELVASGKVKFFLISEKGGMGGQSSDVTKWIEQNGKEIPSSQWKTSASNAGRGGADVLYEVKA